MKYGYTILYVPVVAESLDDRIDLVHARESVKEVCAHRVPSRAPSVRGSERTNVIEGSSHRIRLIAEDRAQRRRTQHAFCPAQMVGFCARTQSGDDSLRQWAKSGGE